MTNEEAIEELKILKEDYWDDDGYGHETKQYADTMFAIDMAIKALEQEPILDKIRAEIVNLTNGDTPERIWNVDVLNIIDKYKAEMESEE